MEYLWYIIAAIGAGVGTGLAGLSAATVMVPILIVLCPSFSGETGAYQATAIALASDILGSAVTAGTYAKHKNIDLKRSWVMMICIWIMCMVGSYVAFLAGNVVLGSFTLFLTFCIGIRFLVKPDTTRKGGPAKGAVLDLKTILCSIFFGITIGFGTGFVGTGGGMMMLIIFTVFFGMDVKTAVGTSTFIMTFTALIASTSHVLIHPAIVLEKWNVLLLCIVVATVTSLVSARFANKVKNRTVGLVTGGVLTVLGASMLILNYWDFLSRFAVFVETLRCLGNFALYVLPCLIVVLLIYKFCKLPKFVFRKVLHLVAFTCVIMMVITAEHWWAPALASLVIVAAVYPILSILENESWYADLFVAKSKGEIKRSLVWLLSMFAFLIAVSWGLFQKPYAGTAAILMWGVGDAAAALIGVPFGKHKVKFWIADGKKSYEGSGAMMLAASVAGFLMLLLYGQCNPITAVLGALVGGLLGTLTELFSPSEYDTITVPVVILAVLLLIV